MTVDRKISQLAVASSATISDVLPIVQSGVTKQIAVDDLLHGTYNVEWWGVTADDSTDNTAAYATMVSELPAGATVFFPASTSAYRGTLIPTKAITINVNWQTLRPANAAGGFCIDPTGTLASSGFILTGTHAYGTKALACTATITGISAGDLVLVTDDTARPSDSQLINFEVHKVASVSGSTVTLEVPLRYAKAASATANIKKITPVSGVRINQFTGAGFSGSTTNGGIRARYCSDVRVNGSRNSGMAKEGVLFFACYDVHSSDAQNTDPSATGSGQGYGVVLDNGTRVGTIERVFGRKMRHDFTFNSAWDFKATGFVSELPVSTPFMLLHNSIGGFFEFEGQCHSYSATMGQACVIEDQGYSSPYSAVCRHAKIRISASPPRTASNKAFHAQIPLEDCDIDIDATGGDGSALSGTVSAHFAAQFVSMENRRTTARVRGIAFDAAVYADSPEEHTASNPFEGIDFDIEGYGNFNGDFFVRDMPYVSLARLRSKDSDQVPITISTALVTPQKVRVLKLCDLHIDDNSSSLINDFGSHLDTTNGVAGHIERFVRKQISGSVELTPISLGAGWAFTLPQIISRSVSGGSVKVTSSGAVTSAATAFASLPIEGYLLCLVNVGANDVVIQNAATVVNDGAASVTLNATKRSASWRWQKDAWYQVA